jgi:outer membrane protein TolC
MQQGRMPYIRTSFALVVLIFGGVTCGSAQIQPSNPDSALIDILRQLPGAPLALPDAIRQSMQSSPSVRAAEASLSAARGVARREGGAFDPELSLSWHYVDQEQPTSSFFAGASVLRTVQANGQAGLFWNAPTGTSIQATLDANRLTTNSSFAFLSPQYTTVGGLTLRQPLLRGFTISARKNLTTAELAVDAAEAQFNQATLSLSTQVEQLYWDLYAGERDYAVQKLTRDRAAAFLKETEMRAKVGLIGPNQVANARTFLAEQEILLLDREENLDGLSDQMAVALGMRPGDSQVRFKTVGQPRDDFPVGEADSLVQAALDRNLELQAARADIDARRTLARASTWEALPSLDFVASIGGNGLSGTAHDVIFGHDTLRTIVGGGFSDAVRQAVNRDYPTWSVGLELNVPIGFRTGLGEEDRLDAEVVMAEQRYEQLKRMLEAEVRAGCRELSHGQRRREAAREGVAAAQEQVRIGQIEFQNGRTTAFELVRLGTDFAVAQQRYSQALVRSAKAAASLRQLTSGAYASPHSLQ